MMAAAELSRRSNDKILIDHVSQDPHKTKHYKSKKRIYQVNPSSIQISSFQQVEYPAAAVTLSPFSYPLPFAFCNHATTC
jgi:hypothetical protein